MTRTLTANRSRAWTAACLATALVASTGLATGTARAEDPAGTVVPIQVEEEAQPATTRPPPPAPPREDGPRFITDWRQGEPIPPGYHPVQRTRTGAIIGGAVTLGSVYMLTAFIAAVWTDVAAATHESNPLGGLFVPVFGPFITLTQSSSAAADVLLIMDGAAQAVGAAVLVWGATSPRTLLERDGYAEPRLMPHPMLLGRDGAGFGLSGTF